MLTLEIELQPGGCQRRAHIIVNNCTRMSTCTCIVPGTFLLTGDLGLMDYRPPFMQRSYLIGTGAVCTRHRKGLERVPRAAVGAAREFAFETERVCSPDASSRHDIYIYLFEFGTYLFANNTKPSRVPGQLRRVHFVSRTTVFARFHARH